MPIKNGVQLWNPAYLTRGPDDLIYGANLTREILSLHDTDGDMRSSLPSPTTPKPGRRSHPGRCLL